MVTAGSALAQSPSGQVDVLYLKNGSVIRGQVVETNPAGNVKIRTSDGSVFVYPMTDVEKIVKEAAPVAPIPPPPQQQVTPQPQVPPPPDETAADRLLRGGVWINGGLSLPVGSFGETTGEEAGLASIGFTGGLDALIPLLPAVGIMMSGVYSNNSADISGITGGLPVSVEAGSWHTVWGLGGVAAGATLDPAWQITAFAQAGVLYGISPEITASAGGITAKQESAGSVAFAYSFGATVRYTRLTLTGRYLAGEPEYETTLTAPGVEQSVKFKQPKSIVTLTLGFVV